MYEQWKSRKRIGFNFIKLWQFAIASLLYYWDCLNNKLKYITKRYDTIRILNM